MNVTVVGLGLMGGSFAMALRKNQLANQIFGVDQSPEHEKEAVQLGIVDQCVKLEEAISTSALIVLATPVDVLLQQVSDVLDRMSPSQFLIDLGSTKFKLTERVKDHSLRGRYVASHPMAGTENTGPKAAFADLYSNAINVICDRQSSDSEAIDMALKLFDGIGMKTVFMEARDHDKHVAYISHLSHVSSFMLGLTVLNKEEDELGVIFYVYQA